MPAACLPAQNKKEALMKHFFISALFLSCAGAYAAEGQVMGEDEIKAHKGSLSLALTHAFEDATLQDLNGPKEVVASAKENLRGCFHPDESFILLKKLWSEDCFKVIGEAWSSGIAPYGLMKRAIVEDGELKEDKKLLPLLDSVYGKEAVALANEQSAFIKDSLIPQIKACDNDPSGAGAQAFSCMQLIETARVEGFDYFQLQGAVYHALSELEAEYKASAGKAAESEPAKRQTSKP